MKQFDFLSKFLDPLLAAIEKLSKVQRIAICCVLLVLLLGAFLWGSYLPKYDKISKLSKEVQNLKSRLDTAKKNASELETFRKKMVDAEAELFVVSKALPEKEEIPTLLTYISRSGQDSGLEFLLFQPGAEIPREFYAEIPVSMKVTGNYHAVALFFDKISKLPRIVNIKDIKMETARQGDMLGTSCTAVTYKFIEPTLPEEKKPESKKTGTKEIRE